MKYTRFIAIASLLTAFAFVGCESSDDIDGNVWKAENSNSSSSSSDANQNAPTTDGTSGTTTDAAVDAVPFSSLNWSFGGFKGENAQLSSPRIGNLKVSGEDLSYSWTGDTLRAWGISDSDCNGALICFFVKRSDGTWVGGKFDWISTSRVTRNLENVFNGYCGWSLAGVPNPCEAAIVMVYVDGSKRSNVTKGTWTR